jgi:hypothetical protein
MAFTSPASSFFEAGGEPVVAVARQQPVGEVGRVVQVLAGVIEVDDLGGGREEIGEVPDPGRAVADDDELADAVGSTAAGLGV